MPPNFRLSQYLPNLPCHIAPGAPSLPPRHSHPLHTPCLVDSVQTFGSQLPVPTLDVEIGRPASFVGQPQVYVSIRDTIRTCAKGVAEGFALQAFAQMFAQMPMGQGRVGVFLLFSFNLEVLD